mmetsp:Transcript_14880/g.32140  ORF Transcript_14880/g.32140 Transcript_14880/m.32140 type:complete len:221 (-) Transcript_14880:317-979(-)
MDVDGNEATPQRVRCTAQLKCGRQCTRKTSTPSGLCFQHVQSSQPFLVEAAPTALKREASTPEKAPAKRPKSDSVGMLTVAHGVPHFAGLVAAFLYKIEEKVALRESGRIRQERYVDTSVRCWLTTGATLCNDLVLGMKEYRKVILQQEQHRCYMSMLHSIETTFRKAYVDSRKIQSMSTDDAAKAEVLKLLAEHRDAIPGPEVPFVPSERVQRLVGIAR